MGSLLINVPDFADDELVFDAEETKQILCFFWPHESQRINALEIGNEGKRLAQTALNAAVEGTYSMNIMNAVLKASFTPGMFTNVGKWTLKLFQKMAKYQWKYAKPSNLMNAKVYDAVRYKVAGVTKPRKDEILNGLMSHNKPSGLYMYAHINEPASIA